MVRPLNRFDSGMGLIRKYIYLVLVVSALPVFASPHSEYSEYIFRNSRIEPADQCKVAAGQSILPHFKRSVDDATITSSDLSIRTVEIGLGGQNLVVEGLPLTGTFWQLEYRQNLGFVYYDCNGVKYFSFIVYARGSLRPRLSIGVSEDDTSIFNFGKAMTDVAAGNRLDPQAMKSIRSQIKAMQRESSRNVVSAPIAPAQPPPPALKPLAKHIALAPPPPPPPPPPAPVPSAPKEKVISFAVVPTSPPPPPPQSPPPPPPRDHRSIQPEYANLPPAVPPMKRRPIDGTDANANLFRINDIAPWHGRSRASLLWTRTAIRTIEKRMRSLNLARDKEAFCPGYGAAAEWQRQACWVLIIGVMMRPESGYNPHDCHKENSGEYSCGLLQMSAAQCRPFVRVSRDQDLRDPVKNIICGVNVLANLIQRDNYISGPRGHMGAARNWSSLQNPHRVFDRTWGRTVTVGQKRKLQHMATLMFRRID